MNTFLNFKTSVAVALQECISQKWTHDDFSDFTVVVEDQEFHCHKFILSACSKFFDGLLRAEMRENLENRAVLKSMSKETFAVIMNAVYKGENDLTCENIIPVWQGTCFLDIPFLVDKCEKFVLDHISLKYFEAYYVNAKLLGSKPVLARLNDFMIKNFQELKDTKTFFELSAEELCQMVDSHFLKVDSEDVVIESILQWIIYKPNNSQVLIDENETASDTCISQKYSSQLDDDVGTNKLSDEQHSKCGNNSLSNEHNTYVAVNGPVAILSLNDNSQCVSLRDKENSIVTLEENSDLHQIRKPDKCDSEENVAQHRENCELHSNDVTDRGNHIIKLLNLSRLVLASRGCLENLVKNSVITSNPEAMNIVYDALMYKYKLFNYRNRIVRYRECSNMVNGVVFVRDTNILFYDFLNCRERILFNSEILKENFTDFVGLTVIDSDVFFTTKKVEKAQSSKIVRESTFKYLNLYNAKDKYLAHLGKSENGDNSFLLNYNNNVICVDRSESEITVFRQPNGVAYGLCFINAGIAPSFATTFEDDILIFFKSMGATGIKKCTQGDKNIVSLPNIEGPADKMASFQHGKYLYLLQKNGNLWLVTRSHTGDIEFSKLEKLWNFKWNLQGAVCYNKQLFVFREKTETRELSEIVFVKKMQYKSLPGVFDGIKVVEIHCQSQVVPMTLYNGNFSQIKIYNRNNSVLSNFMDC